MRVVNVVLHVNVNICELFLNETCFSILYVFLRSCLYVFGMCGHEDAVHYSAISVNGKRP